MTVLFVVVGAAIGAPSRYLIDLAVQSRHHSMLPWGTITVNASGSFVIGLVAGTTATLGDSPHLTALLSTGLCGALTTYSTFSFETVRLIEDDRLVEAMFNVFLTLFLTVVMCFGGYAIAVYLAG